jgi:hypothetical protein
VQTADYTVIEACCSEQSKLGDPKYARANVARITIADDLTTENGVELAIVAVEAAVANNQPTALCGSFPCAAGRARQRLNSNTMNDRRLIQKHRRVFKVLIVNFPSRRACGTICGRICGIRAAEMQ